MFHGEWRTQASGTRLAPAPDMRDVVRVLLLAASVVAAALPSSATAVTPIFLLDTDELTFAFIHRVDPQTGQLTTLGSLPPEDVVVALAAASDNLLYAVEWSGDVLRITLSPFTVTTIGNVGANEFVGLAYGDGVLYAHDQANGALVRIDPTTTAATFVGTIRLPDNQPLEITGGDIVQAANGTWLLWTNEELTLYTLDVATAVATPAQNLVPFNPWFSGLAVDYQAGGGLYGAAPFVDDLETCDQSSGATTRRVPVCLNCPTPYDLAFGDMASPRCTDADRDGFSPEGGTCGARDCNDTIAAVNPGAPDICNKRDDDCDGVVDDGASAFCDDANACTIGDRCSSGKCVAGAQRSCTQYKTVLKNPQCRPSDGACCGKPLSTLLSSLKICYP